MLIGIYVVRGQQSSALASVVRGQDNARKSPPANSSVRYPNPKLTALSINRK